LTLTSVEFPQLTDSRAIAEHYARRRGPRATLLALPLTCDSQAGFIKLDAFRAQVQAPVFAEDGKVTKPATITVVHNGVTVHDRQELMGISAHRRVATYAKHPPTAPIAIQFHGDPIEFRNIWHLPR
jgi:hypothetical protein